MISVSEAYDIVLQQAVDFGSEKIALQDGIGRVLREEWHGDRDLPPYHRVTMDGIGFQYDGVQGKSELQITGVAAAGDPQHVLTDVGACMEVMTGAVLPENCDTVVRYEDLDIADGIARINVDFVKGQNVHYKGEDRKAGLANYRRGPP